MNQQARIDHYLSLSAELFPQKTAVRTRNSAISYSDLNTWCDRIARHLQAQGLPRGSRIAIYMDRSIPAVAAIFGILRAGHAYVPLDIRAPELRTRAILDNCGVALIMTDGTAPEWFIDTGIMTLAVRACGTAEPCTGNAGAAPSAGNDLAYILNTSGSTGIPKGVAVSCHACRSFLDWSFTEFTLSRTDVFANFASFNFDLSVFDLFNAVRAGGTLHIIPEQLVMLPSKLRDYVLEHGITVWYSVPWVMDMITRYGRIAQGTQWPLRLMLFAGEVFPVEALARTMAVFPGASFHNLFGPTETNVCTHYAVPRDISRLTEPVPIGRACCGDTAYVVDESLQSVPPGEEGELVIHGPTLMTEYWNDPDLTARVMLDTLPGAGPGRYYRTGDRVIRGKDGLLHYRGRNDGMIKRRGFRIELGDIEAAARRHTGIHNCAAVAVSDHGTTRIRLAVTPPSALTATAVTEWLNRELPHYMLPDEVIFLNALPRTPNGKIDRKRIETL